MQETPESLMKELRKFVYTWDKKGFTSFHTTRVCMVFERILLDDELLDEAELLDSMPSVGVWVLAIEGQTSTGKPVRFYFNPRMYNAISLRLPSWDALKTGKDKLVFAQALKHKWSEFRHLISDTVNYAELTKGLVVHYDAIKAAIQIADKDIISASASSTNRLS